MHYWLFQNFIRITGFIPYLILTWPIIRYEDKKIQGKLIKGKAIIVSNHTSVYDYGFWLFTLPFRTLRCVMADILRHKNAILTLFLYMNGGIFVSRTVQDLAFIDRSLEILARNGVVEIFPESRLPRETEPKPLEFKPSFVHIALKSGAPVIPLYTSGGYFKKGRVRAVIGKPIDVAALYDNSKTRKENVLDIAEIVRRKVIDLGRIFEN